MGRLVIDQSQRNETEESREEEIRLPSSSQRKGLDRVRECIRSWYWFRDRCTFDWVRKGSARTGSPVQIQLGIRTDGERGNEMKINAICHCVLTNKVNRISLLWREALIESDVAGPSTRYRKGNENGWYLSLATWSSVAHRTDALELADAVETRSPVGARIGFALIVLEIALGAPETWTKQNSSKSARTSTLLRTIQ